MPMSLEEIEAQLHRQAGLPEKKMLSLAEVEAAILCINGRPQQLPIHPVAENTYRDQETIAYLEQQEAALREQEALLYHRERKRREKQRKLAEMVIFLISRLTFF